MIVANGENLTGRSPLISVQQRVEGGLFMEPLYGDFFRTGHTTSQAS